MQPEPSLLNAAHGARLDVAAAGAWTAPHAARLEAIVDAALRGAKAENLSLDLGAVTEIDTFGACLVERLLRGFRAGGGAADMVAVPAHFRGLLNEVERVGAGAGAGEEEAKLRRA